MVHVGMRPPRELFEVDAARLVAFVARAEAAGLDSLSVGDHVSFQGGQGFDGLVQATALAVSSSQITVQTAVYLLPLRHPVPVARQVASLAALAPGRFVFGVGIGGEDRHEVEVCGTDPGSRGRRMDESLRIVRSLLDGGQVSIDGEFFKLDNAQILPAPKPPVPVLVGGRSDAALRRVAEHGDGWLALWVSPSRFGEATARMAELAEGRRRSEASWQHGLLVWCGFADSRQDAAARLAPSMESLYRTPFSAFERYSPCGTPQEVAEALMPYVEAGCRRFTLVPVAPTAEAGVEGAAEVRRLLRAWSRVTV